MQTEISHSGARLNLVKVGRATNGVGRPPSPPIPSRPIVRKPRSGGVFLFWVQSSFELRPHLAPSPREGAGKLYRILTLGGAASFTVRLQSHPRDPPQRYAEFQRTMAEKCL
jgi:hypothetical protein